MSATVAVSSKSTLAATMILPGPITVVSRTGTSSTWSSAAISSRSSCLDRGDTDCPMSSETFARASTQATTSSRTPMRIAATPSHTGSPVTCSRNRPSAASTRPTSAAASSKVTALTVVSVVSARYRRGVVPHLRAAPRTCRTALSQEAPSSTNETARTM